MRELADSQSAGTQAWDFRCECGEPDCDQVVSLTAAEYELLRAGRSPILAERHQPSGLHATREVARELRQEAVALRGQTRLQADRSRRNRDPEPRRLELVCGGCGYGISVERPPDRCPMCSARDWQRTRPST